MLSFINSTPHMFINYTSHMFINSTSHMFMNSTSYILKSMRQVHLITSCDDLRKRHLFTLSIQLPFSMLAQHIDSFQGFSL